MTRVTSPQIRRNRNKFQYIATVPMPIEGYCLDPRETFAKFVVGPSNRIAHAAALSFTEQILSPKPLDISCLFLQSDTGLGKTHLMNAIAWEINRFKPNGKVLFMSSELFRRQYVEAVRTHRGVDFKSSFLGLDLLMVDDFNLLQGSEANNAFNEIAKSLVQQGKKVIIAHTSHVDDDLDLRALANRLRTRKALFLAANISGLDYNTRLRILDHMIDDMNTQDRSFDVPDNVRTKLAEAAINNVRYLLGAVIRLHATWCLFKMPITLDTAGHIIKTLANDKAPIPIQDHAPC